MTLTKEQISAVEALRRELRATITNRMVVPLEREDASTLAQLIEALIAELNERP